MKILLEVLRIICIFALLVTLLGTILFDIYSSLNIEVEKYGWMGGISIFLLLFIFYRNKLQFSGWYKGKNKKLSKSAFILLLAFSVLLFLAPMLLSYLH